MNFRPKDVVTVDRHIETGMPGQSFARLEPGRMYNVVEVRLANFRFPDKEELLMDQFGLWLSQDDTQFTSHGNPGVWWANFFRLVYRPKPELITEIMRKRP